LWVTTHLPHPPSICGLRLRTKRNKESKQRNLSETNHVEEGGWGK